jgi:hypothetical protein
MVETIRKNAISGDVHYLAVPKAPASPLVLQRSTDARIIIPHSKDNLRLFTKTPRTSEKWKTIYTRHTSIERSNKRDKIDYKLESGRHRSTKCGTFVPMAL